MIAGFTGTQKGMTLAQVDVVDDILSLGLFGTAHHGDCIGADADFHKLAKFNGLYVIGHPPTNSTKRAFCRFDVESLPKEYLDRNKDIVDESDVLIACPAEFEEQLRSGTWSTIRYARRRQKDIRIVFPDGTIKVEENGSSLSN